VVGNAMVSMISSQLAGTGAVVWSRFVDESSCTQLQELATELLSGSAARHLDRSTRVWHLYTHGAPFTDLLVRPDFIDVLGRILGPHFLLSDYSLNTVQPRQPVDDWHVDYPYNAMPSILFEPFLGLQCILALGRFTADNGATQYVAGSHLDPDPPSQHALEHSTFTADPGDLLLMSARTSHRSGFNDSEAQRTALLFSFVQRWIRPMSQPHGPAPWALGSCLRLMLGLDPPAGTPYQSPDRI